MGEAVEMILDGLTCEQCSSFIDGEAPGFPRKCDFCNIEHNDLIDEISNQFKRGE